ncbi:type I-G CRISPR-associated RAMP protein Csb1/Cas7g [Yinghuangia sp. YIM S10712]|uniref:type I-G CRISPR-associated RAMP protein Csb1/Cas7g n=1 Tax=Yinghuangia sp. YIM S10712 TaxID=3436930 RepID=UPI003F53278B
MSATNIRRLRYEVELAPVIGSTFQPTGFPDIGPAYFDALRPDGTSVPTLLVESVQSMANRLENTAWSANDRTPVDTIAELPYVRVHHADDPDQFLTTSRQEAHRLTSAFVRDSTLGDHTMLDVITERLGLAKDKPLDFPAMADAITRLDPFSLLHGVFFNQKAWHGQPRFTRAVSAVIEAYDVARVVSGGRKSDSVRHSLGDKSEGGGTSEGYGSIPFHRVEWTARTIKAMFSVDVALLRSYGLDAARTDMLITLAQWEIRQLLDQGLRLRTACDLEPVSEITANAGNEALPTAEVLDEQLRELVTEAAKSLNTRGALNVAWRASKAPKKKAAAAE